MNDAWPRGWRRFLMALLVVYVAKQLVIAFLFPPFTGHDEVAHFEGVRIFATEGRIPTLWTDTLPPDLYAYRQYAIEWHDRNGSPLYTAVHPPLYYVLMAPIYRAAAHLPPEAIQYLLRCASIPFGTMVVLIAALLTRTLFPEDGFLFVTVPTVAAFQPQVSYEAAMINNDALATAIYSALLYLLVLTIRDGASARRAVALGATAGLALLAKSTTIMALGLIPIALWMARGRAPLRIVVRHSAVAIAVALAFVGPWWWFMTRTYGDPMAFSALAGTQPDLTRQNVTLLQLLFSGRFMVDRWTEAWGEFGWKLIHISPALVVALAAVTAAAIAGLVAALAAPEQPWHPQRRWRTQALLLLAAACLLSYLGMVQFGVRFVLTQARYVFPVIDAAVLLAMVGLRIWIPAAWRGVAQAAVVFAAIAMNVTIYTAYVAPYWYFRP